MSAVPPSQTRVHPATTMGPGDADEEIKRASTDSAGESSLCYYCCEHASPAERIRASPCMCRGDLASLHKVCLTRDLERQLRATCSVCHFPYVYAPRVSSISMSDRLCRTVRSPLLVIVVFCLLGVAGACFELELDVIMHHAPADGGTRSTSVDSWLSQVAVGCIILGGMLAFGRFATEPNMTLTLALVEPLRETHAVRASQPAHEPMGADNDGHWLEEDASLASGLGAPTTEPMGIQVIVETPQAPQTTPRPGPSLPAQVTRLEHTEELRHGRPALRLLPPAAARTRKAIGVEVTCPLRVSRAGDLMTTVPKAFLGTERVTPTKRTDAALELQRAIAVAMSSEGAADPSPPADDQSPPPVPVTPARRMPTSILMPV
mmetsp:Transcript_23844/g.70246  ORF Transcript_23844/g.70246 Transcript_23844/m.70246 type:complete len:377 (+) Transcript_23844:78-1208(+)